MKIESRFSLILFESLILISCMFLSDSAENHQIDSSAKSPSLKEKKPDFEFSQQHQDEKDLTDLNKFKNANNLNAEVAIEGSIDVPPNKTDNKNSIVLVKNYVLGT